MSNQTIYNDFRNAGMTHTGACAMMGNFQCESEMHSNNVENRCPISDEEYTARVDSGVMSLEQFCYDYGADGNPKNYGYGLAQWTHPVRKRYLWQFAKNWGVSIAAEDMQTAYAIDELKSDYSALWKYLCATDDLLTATERVCKEYERPAVNNVAERYAEAQRFSEKFYSTKVPAPVKKTDTYPEIFSTIADIEGKLAKLKELIKEK